MEDNIVVFDIIKEWLDKNGFDGLANEDCGCSKEDMCPLEHEDILQCEPAYAHKLTKEEIEQGCLLDGTPFDLDGEPDPGDILYLAGEQYKPKSLIPDRLTGGKE